MGERFDAIAASEGSKLRAAYPGVAMRPPACEALANGAFAVTLDLRGREFQELVAARPAESAEQALEAAFEEARQRLARRAARRTSGLRVVLACELPQDRLETTA